MPNDSKRAGRVTVETIKAAFMIFLRFNIYVRRYRKAETVLIVLGCISVIFSLATPYLGKIILDNGILGRNPSVFFALTIIGAVLYVLKLITEKGDSVLRGRLTRKVKIRLGYMAFKKCGKLSLASFQRSSAGDCVYRMNADINAASGVIANTLPDLTRAFFRIILITIIIAFIDMKILALVLIYQIISAAQLNYFGRRSEELARAAHGKSREITSILTRIFSQVYFVKASGRMAAMFARCFHALADSIRIEADTSKLGAISGTLSDISNKIFFGMAGLAGTLFVIKGYLTLGEFGAIMMYLSMGTGAWSALSGLCQRMVLNRLPLERMAELLDAPIDVKEKTGARYVEFSGGRIEFKNVSFGYDKDALVLDGMNFVIAPGAKIGLVGRSGRGKTTIANLILRLYDVNGGSVFLDGRDVREIRFKSIYSQIAIAPQLPFIWNGTIRTNIAYGGIDLDDAEIIEAAKIAEIHSFIADLPDGYDTALGDMVLPLSQGQKQRLSIARAVANRPKIIILDEACSSLDSRTEECIIDNIRRVFGRATIIMISHRLSAIRKMDAVYFLKRPDEMALGGHDEFMASEREYRELFGGQIVFPSPCPLPVSRGEG